MFQAEADVGWVGTEVVSQITSVERFRLRGGLERKLSQFGFTLQQEKVAVGADGFPVLLDA